MNSLEFKNWIVVCFIILAALLAAGLSVYQYLDGVKKEKKNDSLQSDLIKTQGELNSLQKETIKKIMGDGYIRINVARFNEKEFHLLAESISDYPIYETEIEIFDQEQINNCPLNLLNGINYIMSDCFNSAGRPFPKITMNARKLRPISYKKQLGIETHLMIRILSKHNTTFQYSIISYDNENNMINHFFRIFEADNGMYTLLEQDDYNVDEEIFENAFFYKRDIPILVN